MAHATRLRSEKYSEPVCLLRWTFQKGDKSITCQVEGGGTSAYDVSVVPHWDIGAAVVEAAETSVSAMQRHAEITMLLRQAGWSLARRSS